MIKELVEAGFTEKEAKIYAILYERGDLSAPKVSSILNLERRTVYDVLNSLFSRGYISRKKVQGKEIFSAVKIDIILEDLVESAANLKKAAEESQKKTVSKEDIPQVNILQGIKAVQILINNALKSKSEILLMGRGGYLIEQMGESKHQFVPKLNKLNWRMIQTRDYKKINSDFIPKEIRYLPKDISLDTAFLTFGDQVYLFSKHKNIFIIEIKNKDFAETYKKYFEVFWEKSNK